MATYEITSPQGQRFQITAPDEATQDQVLAYAQQQFASQQEHHQAAIEELKRSNPGEYDPTSKEYQAKYGATSGGSDADNFWAGAGKATVDLGRGVNQIKDQVLDKIAPRGQTLTSLVTGQPDTRAAADQADIDESRQLDAPLLHTKAGVAGAMAGNLATTVVGAGALARGAQALQLGRSAMAARALYAPASLTGAAGAGAVQGALQPVATGESRLVNSAIGAGTGALGQGVIGVAGRVAQPVRSALSDAGARAVQTLQDAGIPLDLAQRTGSTGMQRLKAALQDSPLSAGAMAAKAEEQKAAFTDAALNTLGDHYGAVKATLQAGEPTGATPEILGAIKDRIGGVMDDVASRNPIKLDGNLSTKLAAIGKDARDTLNDQQYGVIQRQLENIQAKADLNKGHIAGPAYQNIRTNLETIAGGPDSSLGIAASNIKKALDQGLQDSAKGADAAAIKDARLHYFRLQQISKAAAPDGSGLVSPKKLASVLTSGRGGALTKQGRGDQALADLARAGSQILPDKVPNSGSVSRALAQVALQGAAGTALGGAAGALTGHGREGVEGGAALGALSLAAPAFAGRAFHSPVVSDYLANGVTNRAVRTLLAAPGANRHIGAGLNALLVPQSSPYLANLLQTSPGQ